VAQIAKDSCDGPDEQNLSINQVTQASFSKTCDVACTSSEGQKVSLEEAASTTPPLPRADDECNNLQHEQNQHEKENHKTMQERYDEAGSCKTENISASCSNSSSKCRLGPKDGPDEVVDPGLMHWNDMPRYLQFNPHILSGYRPLMTPAQCLRSIFCLHNETVNILSH
ncbi:hypothetical protein QAD02_018655, partial [Eretmocerus hayati]